VKKTREQKAITLVALIITIVVLLILALVTINAVRGDGIIGKAQHAKEEYQKKSDEEQSTLEGYLAYLEKNAPGGSSSDGTENGGEDNSQEGTENNNSNTEVRGEEKTFSWNNIILTIGDKVAYNELSNGEKTHSISYIENGGTSSSDSQTLTTQDLDWRVLGINNLGQLELISAQPTSSKLFLDYQEGYLNGERILNTTCNELYGKGNGAESARSLNIDDVDKLAGILTEEDKKRVYGHYGIWWR